MRVLHLNEQNKMLARLGTREELIIYKLNQVLYKEDQSHIKVDILSGKFADVKKGERSSQKNPSSVKTMEQIEAKMIDYWARQKSTEEMEAETKIRATTKISAHCD